MVLSFVVTTYNAIVSPLNHPYYKHGTLIELVLTITPALVFIAIAYQYFKLLSLADEVVSPTMTVKYVDQ